MVKINQTRMDLENGLSQINSVKISKISLCGFGYG